MGNADMQKLKEIRCKCCKKLLARAENIQHLEIKCVRCKTLNPFNK
ncbi:Com family DNA-binding transcriptional regulator [Rodentibacter caecimuris]